MASLRSLKSSIFEREEKKQQYQSHIRGLNAYDRHKKFMKDYAQFYGREGNMNDALPVRTDQDALREGYRFILSEEDDMDSTWEKRLVKRYYDKLFKEYCIADMSQYRKGKIGLRWRTEKEVISGKGNPVNANCKLQSSNNFLHYVLQKSTMFFTGYWLCQRLEKLRHARWQGLCRANVVLKFEEVNFSYVEAGEHKQALVKLVACKSKTEIPLKLSIQDKRKVIAEEQNICAEKLVYRRQKEKEQSTVEKNRDKRKRDIEGSHDSTDDERSKSTDRRKKGRKSTSSGDNNVENEIFDEFLEGMFP